MAETETQTTKPQIGEYFFVEAGQPMFRIAEVYSSKSKGWFIKAEDGSRYLIIQDASQGIWVTLMKIEHGNF